MKRFLITPLLLILPFVISCKQKPQQLPQSNESISQSVKPTSFIPPADSLITQKQVKAWLFCNPRLDSLTLTYADSFSTKEASLRMHYQENFLEAQNIICVSSGLPGGFKEYKWIIQNMGDPRNKAIVQAAGADVF